MTGIREIETVLAAIKANELDGRFVSRLFHGRGKTFEGLEQVTVDWYPPAIFICLFRPVDENWLERLIERIWNDKDALVKSIVVQHRQGAGTKAQVVRGEDLPSPHVVSEQDTYSFLRAFEDTHNLGQLQDMPIEDIHVPCVDGLQFYVNLCNAQNVGIFPDMINGRSWVRHNSSKSNVLNLFSYSCLFSVAAMKGGARQVVNVDMNKSIMATGRKNHALNQLETGAVKFLTHNIFNSWGKIKRLGSYDLIIIDPPSFQKGSFALTKDYQKLIKRLPELASPGGHVMLCLNSPEFGCDFILSLVEEHCPTLRFLERLTNHPSFPEVDEEKSLKVLLFQFSI